MKKWNVRVWCMTASYNYDNDVAPDKQTAMTICVSRQASRLAGIENVRARVMSDMKNWNFSASPAEDVDDSQ